VTESQCPRVLAQATHQPTNVADAHHLLVEAIRLALAGRCLEPLVIHGGALDQRLVQAPDGPLPEPRTAMAAHAKVNGEDGVKAAALDVPRHLPATPSVRTLQKFRTVAAAVCSPSAKTPFQCSFTVGTVTWKSSAISGCDSKSDSFSKPALHAGSTILRLVKNDFGLRQLLVVHAVSRSIKQNSDISRIVINSRHRLSVRSNSFSIIA
jgi:hypothetical protein